MLAPLIDRYHATAVCPTFLSKAEISFKTLGKFLYSVEVVYLKHWCMEMSNKSVSVWHRSAGGEQLYCASLDKLSFLNVISLLLYYYYMFFFFVSIIKLLSQPTRYFLLFFLDLLPISPGGRGEWESCCVALSCQVGLNCDWRWETESRSERSVP